MKGFEQTLKQKLAKGRQVLPQFENVLAWPRTRRIKGSSEGHRGVEVKSVGLGGERKTHTKDHRLLIYHISRNPQESLAKALKSWKK